MAGLFGGDLHPMLLVGLRLFGTQIERRLLRWHRGARASALAKT